MFSILLVAHFLSPDKKDGEDILNVFVKIFQKLVRRGVSIEEREISPYLVTGERRQLPFYQLVMRGHLSPPHNNGLLVPRAWSVTAGQQVQALIIIISQPNNDLGVLATTGMVPVLYQW